MIESDVLVKRGELVHGIGQRIALPQRMAGSAGDTGRDSTGIWSARFDTRESIGFVDDRGMQIAARCDRRRPGGWALVATDQRQRADACEETKTPVNRLEVEHQRLGHAFGNGVGWICTRHATARIGV